MVARPASRSVLDDPQWQALTAARFTTPACDHLLQGTAYRRDCAWCRLNDALDRLENDYARTAGEIPPHVTGGLR